MDPLVNPFSIVATLVAGIGFFLVVLYGLLRALTG